MARLFLAIAIPEEIRERIWQVARELAAFDLRPVPKRNVHFTIRFLGEIPDESIALLQTACREGACSAAPFHVKVEGVGAFPSTRRPRAIFAAGAAPPDPLLGLVSIVGRITNRFEVPLDERPFRLHATIARGKRRKTKGLGPFFSRHDATRFGGFLADQLTLFRSTLRAGPPRYDAIATFPLGPKQVHLTAI